MEYSALYVNLFLHVCGQWTLLLQNFILFFKMSYKYLTNPKPTLFDSNINKFCTQLQFCGFISVMYLY